jgi:hypothetical protein
LQASASQIAITTGGFNPKLNANLEAASLAAIDVSGTLRR